MTNKYIVEGSSTIKSLDYDLMSAVLTVEFKAGSTYTYADVPVGTMQNLYEAESKGKYFSAHIKDKFVTEKVGGYSTNKPAPYGKYPKDHGADVEAAWPFPTSKKP